MGKAEVTIIIVTWNVEDVISDCLDSLFKYSDKEIQVIVVDNDSSDSTCQIIKNYENVQLIQTGENLGFSKANNVALEHALGDYIFYLNPDTIFLDSIINDLVNYLESHENCGIVAPRLLNKDLSLQISYANFNHPFYLFLEEIGIGRVAPKKIKSVHFQRSLRLGEKDTCDVDWAIGAALMLRKEECQRIGGFSEEYFMYGEDTDLCMKVKKILGKSVVYKGDSSLVHLGGVSESKSFNRNKYTVSMQSAFIFANKFDKQNALRLKKSMKNAYMIKSLEFKILYLINHDDKIYYKSDFYKQLSDIVKGLEI